MPIQKAAFVVYDWIYYSPIQSSLFLKGHMCTIILSRRFFYILCAVAGIVLLCGCAEKDEIIHKKLEIICKSDLDTIVAGLPKEGLLDSAYFSFVSYKTYTEGRFSRMAVVDFYFLKTVTAKIVRKYRYCKDVRLWERYFNEYRFYDDTAQTVPR
jgi:hypothetical protein